MAMRPSIFDTKYDGMSSNERAINYERDRYLYEQTVALEQIAKSVNPPTSNLDYNDPIIRFQVGGALSAVGYFETGSPEYFEYAEIAEKGQKCVNNFAILDRIKTLFILILTCAITLGIPLSFLPEPNPVRMINITALPIAIVGIIITSVLQSEQRDKAKEIDKQLAKYRYDHRLKEE